MKIIIPTLLALLHLLCSGCIITVSTHDSIRSSKMVYHEFTDSFYSDDASPIPGRLVESANPGVSRYQWTNALAGSGRILEISIPEHSEFRAEIAECETMEEEESPAYLLPEYMAGKYSPEQYFEDHYPKLDPHNFAGHAVYLGTFSAEPHPQDVFLLVYDKQKDKLEWVRYKANIDIPWKERSKFGYCTSHLKYLYSVPLDIITFPLQFYILWRMAH
jgi:hypothetical protein